MGREAAPRRARALLCADSRRCARAAPAGSRLWGLIPLAVVPSGGEEVPSGRGGLCLRTMR